MYVDISNLLLDNSVTENVSIIGSNSTQPDDYGIPVNKINKDSYIKQCNCIIVEKKTSVLDASKGIYHKTVVYDFYIPTSIVSEIDKLDGGFIIRQNGTKYVITGNPIIRPYISHCQIRATEVRL